MANSPCFVSFYFICFMVLPLLNILEERERERVQSNLNLCEFGILNACTVFSFLFEKPILDGLLI